MPALALWVEGGHGERFGAHRLGHVGEADLVVAGMAAQPGESLLHVCSITVRLVVSA